MKKLITAILVITCLFGAFAGDFKFSASDTENHSEILFGIPTSATLGVEYRGFTFLPGNTTGIKLSAGAGYAQRFLLQNPDTGEPLRENIQIYDVAQFRWGLELSQGLSNDLFTVFAGYEGRWEKAKDSILLPDGGGFPRKDNIERWRGEGKKKPVVTFDDWFNNEMEASSTRENTKIYPDISKDGKAFHVLYLGGRFNMMEQSFDKTQGYSAGLRIMASPENFYGLNANAKGGWMLLENDNITLSVADTVNFTFIDGDAVPVYIQKQYSAGRFVRGLVYNSYNTTLSIVNNMDLRLAFKYKIFKCLQPAATLFFDNGYAFGNYFNTGHNGIAAVEADKILSVLGTQIELRCFELFNIGLQAATIISGEYATRPDTQLQFKVIFSF